MAIVKTVIDVHNPMKDGSYAIRLRLMKDRKIAYISTGLYTLPDSKEIPKDIQSKVNDKEASARAVVRNLMEMGKFSSTSVKDLKVLVAEELSLRLIADKPKDKSFLNYLRSTIQFYNGGTKALYEATAKKIEMFEKTYKGDVEIDEINRDWLERFDAFLAKTAPMPNSRAVHMRNIRATFNRALDNELTTHYPFRTFNIKHNQTQGNALNLAEFRLFCDFPLTTVWQTEARDIWLLSLYLGGINAIDLLHLQNLPRGRCVYKRRKTGRLYDMPVPKEALEIIEKYKGESYLLNFAERYKDYKDFLRHIDRNLKTIGKTIVNGKKHEGEALFPNLTYYDARRTLATIAYEIGIPEETISEILGHSFGLPVTNLYIRKSGKVIDSAMERIMNEIRSEHPC